MEVACLLLWQVGVFVLELLDSDSSFPRIAAALLATALRLSCVYAGENEAKRPMKCLCGRELQVPLSLPGSTLVLLRGHHVHNQLSYCSTSWCLGGFRVPGIEQGPPSHMQTLWSNRTLTCYCLLRKSTWQDFKSQSLLEEAVVYRAKKVNPKGQHFFTPKSQNWRQLAYKCSIWGPLCSPQVT